LPSAREKVLGKEGFVDALFAEPSLLSATLGKAFAECFYGFAECFGPTAKTPVSDSVVLTGCVSGEKKEFLFHVLPMISLKIFWRDWSH
jgi:hypothetical protein